MQGSSDSSLLTAGGALFGKLKALGVSYVFANSGTDFPPIIEGLIEARSKGVDLPQAVTVPHEHVAVGMAHGYYQISGHAQVVLLHTNVGLSNGATGAINAACDQVPMFLMSGRTPVMEGGRFGARTVPIGWGQEMHDQSALVREACKWTYELRFPDHLAEVLDRGWTIANSIPKGPVYLSLPREVLCEPCPLDGLDAGTNMAPVAAAPDRAALATAATLLAKAERPLVIAQRGAGSQKAFEALAELVEDWAIPLSHYWANQIAIPMTSPCHVDWSPDALVRPRPTSFSSSMPLRPGGPTALPRHRRRRSFSSAPTRSLRDRLPCEHSVRTSRLPATRQPRFSNSLPPRMRRPGTKRTSPSVAQELLPLPMTIETRFETRPRQGMVRPCQRSG